MYRIKSYFIILVIFGIASCEKDITVKLPPYTSKLTINSSTEVGDTIKVRIGVTTSADHKKPADTGALSVELYIDSVFSEKMVYNNLFDEYISSQVAVTGKQYSIKVISTAPSYGTAYASANCPSKVIINSVTRLPNTRIDADGNSQDELKIIFNDPPGAGDHYVIEIQSAEDSAILGGTYTFCVNSTDQNIETNTSDFIDVNTCLKNDAIFLRDALFNGTQKELTLYVSSQDIQPYITPVDTSFSTIKLRHITVAGYKYLQTSQIAKDTNGDPFSEPVNVYTNVTNGQGIFTMTGTDKVWVK